MSSLREIKDRIASVKGTLKITSAMKLVASAKLRKSQNAIDNMRPYEALLKSVLSKLPSAAGAGVSSMDSSSGKVAVLVLSSNSSLCGGFNANVEKAAKSCLDGILSEGRTAVVYAAGRKVADYLKKSGFAPYKTFNQLCANPAYEPAAELAEELLDGFRRGEFERVELVYNHFAGMSNQKPVVETYLPFAVQPAEENEAQEYIIEPDEQELLEELLPKVLKLKIYTVFLDSVAAEHAARMIAMQTATDNGEELLKDLTLEYNKGRQQKITTELLDLVGGQQE